MVVVVIVVVVVMLVKVVIVVVLVVEMMVVVVAVVVEEEEVVVLVVVEEVMEGRGWVYMGSRDEHRMACGERGGSEHDGGEWGVIDVCDDGLLSAGEGWNMVEGPA